MARTKIDYGIDLGTTNSAIARIDGSETRIIKSDDSQSDTTPSGVSFNKRRVLFCGMKAYNQISAEAGAAFKQYSQTGKYPEEQNAYAEFKRTMGTDKEYKSSYMGRSYSSEELSAEVLKKLKSYVRDDDDLRAVVITVPAMFQQNQIDATQRAAELAGFRYCELLQEPIAASLAYGLSTDKLHGYWLVFDFGGGTFDAALMRVVEGIIKVHDTSGDNHLGGKNIDYAIVDDILIPHLEEEFDVSDILNDGKGKNLLRDALKRHAEEIKIALASKDKIDYCPDDDIGRDGSGEEIMIDRTITLSEFENVCEPIIQRAIDICEKLLRRNNITGKDLEKVILVGGPTYLQTLRRMLREQITPNIEISIDPMTAVARGAALFASTKDIPSDMQIRDRAKIQLKLKYPETTVEYEEKLGIKLERTSTKGAIPQRVFVEVSRDDKGWSSGRVELEGDAEIINIHLLPGKNNGFQVALFDEAGNRHACEPSSFTIIQGLKFAKATLPYYLCVEALVSMMGKQCIFPIKGLEKNTSLPAKGKDVFKTQKDIRPGIKTDCLEMRLYNTEQPYSRAFTDEHAGTFVITGEDLPQFLPKDSDVELTIEVDASRRISCQAYFPYIDETKEHVFESLTKADIDSTDIEQDIDKAQKALDQLREAGNGLDATQSSDIEKRLDEIENSLQKGGEDYDCRQQVAARLREIWKELDDLHDAAEWPRVEESLNDAFAMVEVTQARYGSDKTADVIADLKQKAGPILKNKDIKLARILLEHIYALDFMMIKEDIGLWVSWLKRFDDEFSAYAWKDKNRARNLITEGKQLLQTKPSKAKIEEIVRELYRLLPEKEQSVLGGIDERLLKK